MAINSNEYDTEIEIPPQELLAYEIPEEESEDFFETEGSNSDENLSDGRLERIIKSLRLDHLNKEERDHVITLVTDFSEIFHLPGEVLPSTDVLQHSIPTTDDGPVFVKQYRYPPAHREEIQRQISELIKNGIIEDSTSPYSSPLWIVPKKADSKGNKRWRMVVDYRALNEKTVGDAYPLPNITEILDRLGSAKYFSIFDLASGFHQIKMNPEDKHKTAFSTTNGHYQYVRMPFGLKNAPATFQRLMNLVLLGLQESELLVYLDDVIIYASDLEEHDKKVRRLFNRLLNANLSLQPDKCEFLTTEVEYLGHVINENGIMPDSKKTEAVRNFPRPKNQTNIRQFLGLAGYYRRFIEGFSKRAKPLSDLLKKSITFKWTDEHQESFEDLKDALCKAPVLQHPDFSQPFILTTDASDFAVGAVLSQGKIGEDKPIAYMSKIMKPAEKNYTTTEKECLAIIYAVLHFRPYLYGREFTLISDHEPLKWIDSVKPPVQRLIRWRTRLREYEYKFLHKPGRLNINADSLSRNPTLNNAAVLPISSSAKLNQNAGRQATSSQRGRPPGVKNKPKTANPIEPGNLGSTIAERLLLRKQQRGTDPLQPPVKKVTFEDPKKRTTATPQIKVLPSKPPHPNVTIRLPSTSELPEFINQGPQTSEDDVTESEEPPPVGRKRYSGFPSQVPQVPPIRRRDSSQNEGSSEEDKQRKAFPPNKQIKEVSGSSSSPESAEYYWDYENVNDILSRPLARSTPVEDYLLQDEEDEPINLTQEKLSIIDEDTDESSTETVEAEEPNIMKTSDTISPELFYPDYMKEKESKLKLRLVNHSLTHKKDNILHFISADCEFVTPISKLLIDLGRINTINIKNSKPTLGNVIVTPRSKLTLSGVVKRKHFEKLNLSDLKLVLKNVADTIRQYQIKTLNISKYHDMTDSISFSVFLDTIKASLKDCDCTIHICYGSITIPPEDIREQIIQENHDSVVAGHRGITKTYHRIREKFSWAGLKADVTEYVRNCTLCQKQKLVRIKNREPMIITDMAKEPFDKISIDTVGPLPLTPNGNKHILTIQDNLTKYCIAVPVPDTKAETVADALARHVISLYGAPRIILSDKAKSLTGKIMQQLAKIFKIKQVTTSGYHPQSNGSLERSHLVLIEYIRQYIEKYEDWDQVLPFAVFSYNTSLHESTGFTPYELIFGHPARTPSSFPVNKADTYSSYMEELINRLDDIRGVAAKNLQNSKYRNKTYYDRKVKQVTYNIGDLVYVLKEPRKNKLDNTYKGPYTIVNILENNNVVLENENKDRFLKHMDKIKLAHHSSD